MLRNLHKNLVDSSRKWFSTIYALSSGKGKCGVAVIRVSGSQTKEIFKNMVKLEPLSKPRTALLRSIRDPFTNDVIDKGLVLWFPAPNSFTGEDCCELQVHGGLAVIAGILSGLGKLKGFRPAEAGEFTRRAFYAGKLDLVEVEGLADLLQAETELQLKQALIQADGSLSKLFKKWRLDIMQNLAHLEAHIDFDETEGLESDIPLKIKENSLRIAAEIEKHLKDGRRGERLRSGVKTVIIGKPNVGKSSLLNFLSNRPTAIVTPIAGTTRDALETTLNINGYPIVLVDTAGLRSNTNDLIEIEGIKRTVTYAEQADLILAVFDAVDVVTVLKNKQADLKSSLLDQLNNNNSNNYQQLKNLKDKQILFVINKIDLLCEADRVLLTTHNISNVLFISCLNNEGTDQLMTELTSNLEILCGQPSAENPMLSQVRHRNHLEKCKNHLLDFTESINNYSYDIVLAAESLRLAMNQLGKITGAVSTEQLLDVIFKEFCIGK